MQMWISYGYDGAIAGTFLVMHMDRPIPEKIGVESITEHFKDGSYSGTLPDGVVTVKKFKQFLHGFEENADDPSKLAWQRMIQEHLNETKPVTIDKVMVEKQTNKSNKQTCSWCGGAILVSPDGEFIIHVPGCPRDDKICVGYKDPNCENISFPHPSGLCMDCYQEYKQDLRDGKGSNGVV